MPPELSADQRAVLDACNEIVSFGTLMKMQNWARNGGTDTWTSMKGEFAQALLDAETGEKYLTISDDSTPSAEPPSESYSWSTACASMLYDDDLTALADDVLRHIELLPPRNHRLDRALPFLVAEAIRKRCQSRQAEPGRPSTTDAGGTASKHAQPTVGVVATPDDPSIAAYVIETESQTKVAPLGGVVPDNRLPTPGECPAIDTVVDILISYVIWPDWYHAHIVALWIAHTFCIDKFDTTPRLLFGSPEPECGKTRCLDLCDLLANNPTQMADTTPAALFRSIEAAAGNLTVLHDEIEAVFKPGSPSNSDRMRSMLNAGYKRGATVQRAQKTKDQFTPRTFQIFAPVAMAGIGNLPATLASRCISIPMRRRKSNENVQRFRRRDVEPRTMAARQALSRWVDEAVPKLTVPDLPDELIDRAAELWEPLIQMAELAGSSWAKFSRVAAVATVAAIRTDKSRGSELLQAIKNVFDSSTDDKMYTDELIAALTELEEIDVREEDPISLSNNLKPFGIRPRMFRRGIENRRGYYREDFKEAWDRYL